MESKPSRRHFRSNKQRLDHVKPEPVDNGWASFLHSSGRSRRNQTTSRDCSNCGKCLHCLQAVRKSGACLLSSRDILSHILSGLDDSHLVRVKPEPVDPDEACSHQVEPDQVFQEKKLLSVENTNAPQKDRHSQQLQDKPLKGSRNKTKSKKRLRCIQDILKKDKCFTESPNMSSDLETFPSNSAPKSKSFLSNEHKRSKVDQSGDMVKSRGRTQNPCFPSFDGSPEHEIANGKDDDVVNDNADDGEDDDDDGLTLEEFVRRNKRLGKLNNTSMTHISTPPENLCVPSTSGFDGPHKLQKIEFSYEELAPNGKFAHRAEKHGHDCQFREVLNNISNIVSDQPEAAPMDEIISMAKAAPHVGEAVWGEGIMSVQTEEIMQAIDNSSQAVDGVQDVNISQMDVDGEGTLDDQENQSANSVDMLRDSLKVCEASPQQEPTTLGWLSNWEERDPSDKFLICTEHMENQSGCIVNTDLNSSLDLCVLLPVEEMNDTGLVNADAYSPVLSEPEQIECSNICVAGVQDAFNENAAPNESDKSRLTFKECHLTSESKNPDCCNNRTENPPDIDIPIMPVKFPSRRKALSPQSQQKLIQALSTEEMVQEDVIYKDSEEAGFHGSPSKTYECPSIVQESVMPSISKNMYRLITSHHDEAIVSDPSSGSNLGSRFHYHGLPAIHQSSTCILENELLEHLPCTRGSSQEQYAEPEHISQVADLDNIDTLSAKFAASQSDLCTNEGSYEGALEMKTPTHPPKGILKQSFKSCRMSCKCIECESVRSRAEKASKFSQQQMHDIEGIASLLIRELKSMRTLMESTLLGEGSQPTLPREEVKTAADNACKIEGTAKKWLIKMARDCNRYCKLMETQQRKLTFADEAGKELCHVKLFHRSNKAQLVHEDETGALETCTQN